MLSGINLGRWGRDSSSGPTRETLADPRRMSLADLDREALAKLIRAILTQTALPRLRLSSIEPMDWDNELIALFGEFGVDEFGVGEFGGSRLARHAHLPLQSGSDAVLRRMHRRYRPWHYADKVAALLRAAGPDLTLGADVMVGFPGETDREFEETLAFIRALPFGYLHLFPFSPRPGTPGWALHAASPVPRAVVEERMAELRALAAEKTLAHRQRFIGRELSAITFNTPTLKLPLRWLPAATPPRCRRTSCLSASTAASIESASPGSRRWHSFRRFADRHCQPLTVAFPPSNPFLQ